MGNQDDTGAGPDRAEDARGWTVFSSHGRVLFYLAAHPDATLRAIGDAVGLTERRVAGLVKDLAGAGMLRVERRGRRNRYRLDPATRLEHPPLAPIPLARLVAAVVPEAGAPDGAGGSERAAEQAGATGRGGGRTAG